MAIFHLKTSSYNAIVAELIDGYMIINDHIKFNTYKINDDTLSEVEIVLQKTPKVVRYSKTIGNHTIVARAIVLKKLREFDNPRAEVVKIYKLLSLKDEELDSSFSSLTSESSISESSISESSISESSISESSISEESNSSSSTSDDSSSSISSDDTSESTEQQSSDSSVSGAGGGELLVSNQNAASLSAHGDLTGLWDITLPFETNQIQWSFTNGVGTYRISVQDPQTIARFDFYNILTPGNLLYDDSIMLSGVTIVDDNVIVPNQTLTDDAGALSLEIETV